MKVTDEMVGRFLSWRLPATVWPDGIYPVSKWNEKWALTPMTGTNLLTASEARAMLQHVLQETPE